MAHGPSLGCGHYCLHCSRWTAVMGVGTDLLMSGGLAGYCRDLIQRWHQELFAN